MRKNVLAFAALAALTGVSATAGAALLAEYNFGQSGPQFVASDMTASNAAPTNLAVFNVAQISSTYGSSNPFLQTAPQFGGQGDLAGAVARNEYWSVTLTPDAGYFLDLDSLSFLVFRGGASGNRGFAVYSSVDGFVTPLVQVANESGTRSAPRTETLVLSSAYDNLTSPVTFRFYIHSINNASSIEFDDLRFFGSVSAIPEPAALGLLLVPAVGLMRRR